MLGRWFFGKSRQRASRGLRGRRASGSPSRVLARIVSRPSVFGATLVAGFVAMALMGERRFDYTVGQRIDQPIYAKVTFSVPDPQKTEAERTAARAKTPSYYMLNPPALTYDRVRADLMRIYQTAVDAKDFESFGAAQRERGWPIERSAYDRLRSLVDLPNDAGRTQFQQWVDELQLEEQYVVRNLSREPRDPSCLVDFIHIEMPGPDGQTIVKQAPHSELVPQGNEKALRGAAVDLARRFPAYEIKSIVEAVVLTTFREQPTIVFNAQRTVEAMRASGAATPEAMVQLEGGEPFIKPGTIDSDEYRLLLAHEAAYAGFLSKETPEALQLRRERDLVQGGRVVLVALLAIALAAYTGMFHPDAFQSRRRTLVFASLMLAAGAAVRLLETRWPQYPGLHVLPCVFAASVLAVVSPRRSAIGSGCILVTLIAVVIGAKLTHGLTLFACVVTCVYQLDEIRSRTKLPRVGFVTAGAVMIVAAAGTLLEAQLPRQAAERAAFAGACALMSAFCVAALLPFVERIFGTATSLTLLEWRDPTRPLLQRLAQEAPGTYTHSLALGTLAEAACARIGANGLLAQVGALYHDVGKLHRPAYFTENQEGRISRHENLAPTMSLLIILGHVRDGLELAQEYKLPKILHQFVAEHHGTTVVRYFHRMAAEKHEVGNKGRHDREVLESDFRYPGPKPRSREAAIVMICDGVEGAVRALADPTVGRIESTVQHIIADRLADGQFDECDITLREIHQVEESLVKTLCGLYHGRVAYPKPRLRAEPAAARRISV